jgi:ABC-type dipeptide/oligopeptide/nickel transport system ATPase component
MSTILDVSDLSVTFPARAGNIRASQRVNFRMQKGEISALVGETGSGKSVIGLAILHLLPESAIISGSVRYNGKEILSISDHEYSRLRGREISLVPQNPSGSLDPLMKCGKQISESLEIRGVSKLKQSDEVENLLTNLHFSDPKLVAASLPHELSGGMRQRITTGIALASEPKLLVSDEPTKGLDYTSRKTSMEMFLHLKHIRKDTHLLITHDLDLARMIGDTINVLYSGEIIESGTVE